MLLDRYKTNFKDVLSPSEKLKIMNALYIVGTIASVAYGLNICNKYSKEAQSRRDEERDEEISGKKNNNKLSKK